MPNPASDQTEPTFTAVLLAIITEYVEKKAVDGKVPTITRLEDNRFLWQTGTLSMSVTINDVSKEYGNPMGARIGKNNFPSCHCGNPLPCRKHTPGDGDTADHYNPDINRNVPEGEEDPGEQQHRHEKN